MPVEAKAKCVYREAYAFPVFTIWYLIFSFTQLDPRKKIAIGVNFSSENRSVEEFLVKELD